jgi:hypothetical protein
LGLDRDAYLSIVKFLNSSIVRRVWLNTFILFIFYIFVVIVHWNKWRIIWNSEIHPFCYSPIKKYYYYL